MDNPHSLANNPACQFYRYISLPKGPSEKADRKKTFQPFLLAQKATDLLQNTVTQSLHDRVPQFSSFLRK
jgi:hypothetical protein